jgi:hypothetical protein
VLASTHGMTAGPWLAHGWHPKLPLARVVTPAIQAPHIIGADSRAELTAIQS